MNCLLLILFILGYSNQKEIYVAQLDLATGDGTLSNPFPNLITAFKSLEMFTQLEINILLLSQKYLILEEYFIQNNYELNSDSGKYEIFIKEGLQIYLTTQNCFESNECSEKSEIGVKFEQFILNVQTSLKIESIYFNGIDINADSFKSDTCYSQISGYCCQIINESTVEQNCLVQNSQVNRTITSNSNNGMITLKGTTSQLKIFNCLFEYFSSLHSFNEAFYSLVYTSDKTSPQNFLITLQNIQIKQCYFYGGILNSQTQNTSIEINGLVVENFNFYNIYELGLDQAKSQLIFNSYSPKIQIQNTITNNCRLEFHSNSIIEISNSQFKNSQSNLHGALLYFEENSNIQFRHVQMSDGSSKLSGGCLYFSQSSNITFQNAEISQCTSLTSGGAIMFESQNNITFAQDSQLRIAHNLAGTQGGGIYFATETVIDMQGTVITFENNTAEYEGGGIYCVSSVTKFELQSETVNFIANIASDGGCIYFESISNPIVILFDISNFLKNTALYNGGCIHLSQNNNLTLTGNSSNACLFNSNTAGLSGGIFYASFQVFLSLSNLNFEHSMAISQGGSIYLGDSITAVLKNIVTDDTVSGSNGAFLQFNTNGNLSIYSLILSNSGAIGGDGILNLGQAIDTKIYDSIFQNTSVIRGTITLSLNNILYIKNSTFSFSNTKYGGHFRIKTANQVTIINCNFTQSETLMGGLMMSDFHNIITIRNIMFAGGVAYRSGSFLSLLENITILIYGDDYCDISDIVFFIYYTKYSLECKYCLYDRDKKCTNLCGKLFYSQNFFCNIDNRLSSY